MAKISKQVMLAVLALACVLCGYTPNASAAGPTVPTSLTQQGRLLASDGTPIDGNPVNFTFGIYAAATGGTAIWFEQLSVTPDNGYFSARLGESKQFDPTLFDGSRAALYLGIKVGNDPEMTPRQQITSVPFALLAANALHANSADTATSATSATNATNATNAMTAVTATNAGHATVADTVTSIAGNFTVKFNSLVTNSTTLACDSGTVIVGGFCQSTDTIVTTGLTSSSQNGDIHSKTYNCACKTSGCGLTGSIVCAK